jgi:hypothetical protein
MIVTVKINGGLVHASESRFIELFEDSLSENGTKNRGHSLEIWVHLSHVCCVGHFMLVKIAIL